MPALPSQELVEADAPFEHGHEVGAVGQDHGGPVGGVAGDRVGRKPVDAPEEAEGVVELPADLRLEPVELLDPDPSALPLGLEQVFGGLESEVAVDLLAADSKEARGSRSKTSNKSRSRRSNE